MFKSIKICNRLTTYIPLLLVSGMMMVSAVSLINLGGNLLADRKDKAKTIVELIISSIAKLYDSSQSGEITEGEAKKLSLMLATNIKFEDGNYVWVNDFKGVILSHPKLSSGESHLNIADGKGVYFVKLILNKALNGGGFVNYYWQREEHAPPTSKISYAATFKPWGWIIGSGIYVDDVEAVFLRNALIVGVISFIAIAFVLVGTKKISSSIFTPINEIASTLGRISSGDKISAIPYTNKNDEIGNLARAFEQFINSTFEDDRHSGKKSHSLSHKQTAIKNNSQAPDPFDQAT